MPENSPRPYYIFDESYRQGEFPNQSVYPSGFFSAAWRSMLGAIPDLKRRWSAPFETEETITQDEFKSIIGDRPIDFYHGIDKRTAEFLVQDYDMQVYMSQYEKRPIAEFLGSMLPYMLDPISIATMPVGGTAAMQALKATTLRGFLKNAFLSGAQAGVASAALEPLVELKAYGKVDYMRVLEEFVGPVIAAPILLAPARALRGFMSHTDILHAARGVQPETAGFDGERLLKAFDADSMGVTPPPPVRDPGGLTLPSKRFNEMFADYTGGHKQWVRDFSTNVEEARNFLRRHNIDPDSPILKNFIDRHKEASAKRAALTSLEDRFTHLQDISDYIKGRAAPDQIERLKKVGVLQEVKAAKEVLEKPGVLRTAEEILAVRGIEAKEKELAGLAISPAFKEISEILKKPQFGLTADEFYKVNNFYRFGAEGEMARHIENVRTQYEAKIKELQDFNTELSKRKGRKPKAMLEKKAQLEAERIAFAEEIARYRNDIPAGDGELRVEDLMVALDAASLESPKPESIAPAPTELDSGVILTEPKDLGELEAHAKKFGVDVEETREYNKLLQTIVKNC